MKIFRTVCFAFFPLALVVAEEMRIPPHQAKRLREELEYLETSAQDLEIELPDAISKARQEGWQDEEEAPNTFWALETPPPAMVEDEIGISYSATDKTKGKAKAEDIPDDIDLNSLEKKIEDMEEGEDGEGEGLPHKRQRRR